MKPLLFVAGTRPELLKILPVVLKIRKKYGYFCQLCFTNQHKHMAKSVFRDFQMKPDMWCCMRRGGSLSARFLRLYAKCRRVVSQTDYAAVCVQGDTTSAFAGALAGFLCGLPVCHLEAGLRTYQNRFPFPEEMMRRSIDAMADFHFCSSPSAYDNLVREGIDKAKIFLVGNTGEDSLAKFMGGNACFPKTDKLRILLTLHRRETEDAAFQNLLETLANDAKCGHYEVLFPVHASPRMKKLTKPYAKIQGFFLLPPLPPAVFYPTLNSADLVITDSGGISEESAVLGIPTLVYRRQTEREAELKSRRITLWNGQTNIRDEITRALSLPKKPTRFQENSPSAAVSDILYRLFSSNFD